MTWWQPTPRDIRVWYVIPAKTWREHLDATTRARVKRVAPVAFPDAGRVATAVIGPVMRHQHGDFVRMLLSPVRPAERRRRPAGCGGGRE